MSPFVIPIVAILMPLVLVPTVITLKHRHKRLEWEHKERMRALETRLPVSMRQAAGAGGVAAIGAGVPMIAVLGAFLTSLTVDPTHFEDGVAVYALAWGCASMISGGAFVTSLILYRMQARAATEAYADAAALDNGKLAFDPDAFDVVSSRN